MRIAVDTELAWAAGFFDGEGSVGTYVRKPGKSGNRVQLTVQVTQTDRRPLERLASATGRGRINGPYGGSKLSRRPVYRWTANGPVETREIYELLAPYLGPEKSAAFQAALTRWAELKEGTPCV